MEFKTDILYASAWWHEAIYFDHAIIIPHETVTGVSTRLKYVRFAGNGDR